MTDVTFQVRSNEQLLILLKLVDVNQLETKRRNVGVRQKIWEGITEKLNRLASNGAEKDVEGWKRCYKTWCLGAGPEYKLKMQDLLKQVPQDGNYLIEVSEDEAEADENNFVENLTNEDPIKTQKELLHKLILKHKMLLTSTANDKPLKVRLWQNIAEQLNAIPGALTLTPKQWRKRVDLKKYQNKRGRKPMKRAKTKTSKSHCSSSSNGSCDDSSEASTSSKNYENSQILQVDTNEIDEQLEEIFNENLIEGDFLPSEIDFPLGSEPENKRLKSTPLVQTFTISNRIINSIEELKNDVQNINNTLKQTTDSLISMRNIMERQSEQQDEFNTLLKRSTQFLKVLVEFKIGKRLSANKRNFNFNNSTENC